MNTIKKTALFKNNKVKWFFVFIILLLLTVLSLIFIAYTYKANLKETEQTVISLAEAAAAGLSKTHLYSLSSDETDIHKTDYKELKNNLINIVKLHNDIRFAYIFVQKEDAVVFAVDSEPVESEDYSPPGQEYTEADDVLYSVFESGVTILAKPAADRWGTWVSALVPMRSQETGEIIAVFGVDYPAENWYSIAVSRTVQAYLIALSLLIIFVTLSFLFRRNKDLRGEKAKLLESEEKLKESEALFRTIFDRATVGIALAYNNHFISAYKGYTSINPKFEKILGRTRDELAEISWKDLTHPDDLQSDTDKFSSFKAGILPGYNMEKRFIRPDGSAVWVHMIISPLYLESNTDAVHICVIEDISSRKQMEKVLYDSERSKSVLLSNIPGMAYRCKNDMEWTMEFISEGCYALTGYKPESLLNNKEISFCDIIPSEYRDNLRSKTIDEKSKFTEEYEIITASGEKKWVWEQGQGVFDETGQVEALEGLIIDITDRKNHEIKLNHMNYHDQLTSLSNRRYFEYIINRDLSDDPDFSGTKKAVLLVNIKKFSLLNITYGYVFCENLIKELASELMFFTNEQCSLFHISIDRFILYLNGYEEKNDLTDLCKSIIAMLNNVLTPKIIGANVGVVEINSQNRDAETIIKNASIAAVNVGINKNFGYSFYNIQMAETAERENEIKTELADTAYNSDNDHLYMFYQPILDIKTDRISGFEALARFRSGKYGMLSPAEFIPIAEESQLIVPLGRQIMRKVCRAVKKFENRYTDHFVISFNISVIQLLRDDFITDLTEIIEETGVNTRKLGIELTESVFSNNYGEINDKFDKIRELGIKIAIDDFGTGYSSLARERELNVDYLKIDKFFIEKLMEFESDGTITSDIISIGHKLGHSVIAEGVEYEKQKEYLIQHSCDKIQGYLFSVPLDEEIALEFLQNNKAETGLN